ncbi:MAG: hypothetical protein RR547_00920 [Raoultibacter sp.]
MQKIAINRCFGSFGLSGKAAEMLRSRWSDCPKYLDDLSRDNDHLVSIVEELGDEAGDLLSELLIVEIPDGVDWQIESYDGIEWVAEAHRTWPTRRKKCTGLRSSKAVLGIVEASADKEMGYE